MNVFIYGLAHDKLCRRCTVCSAEVSNPGQQGAAEAVMRGS